MNGTAVELSTTTESQKLAVFALGLAIPDIPIDVLNKAKLHLLDALGIALASSRFEFGRIALRGVQKLGQGDEATAIGSGARLPATSAALVNGLLAHGLDFDDTHIGAIYHASAPALAAVLAAGQANRASGAESLVAFIVALEIGCRLGTVAAGEFHHRGFHPTALCGTFAAAAAGGRLARIDEEALVWSLGLCGSQAAGILEIGDSWLKRMHPGWAAHSGLVAVALGSAGFLGPHTVFEGARGFYATHTQTVPEGNGLPSFEIGRTWQTRGIALKPYPCCHFIHAFVDAALELRGQFELDDIERIDCPLTPALHKLVAEPRDMRIRPSNPYQALFSVQYVVALALARGRVDVAAFHDEPLNAPEILGVADRTYCVDDPGSDFPAHFPGEVVVHLKDGRVFQCRKATSLGTPDRPMPQSDIEAKFIANATRAIDGSAAEKLVEQVLHIESADSLEAIMSLCKA